MAKKPQKKKTAPKPAVPSKPKDFLDMAAPSVVKFNTDQAIIGCGYHTFLALRGYAASTEELALLSRLGAKDGVNLSLYARQVTAAEEKQIIQNASNKNRLTRSNTNDLQQSVAAESDLQDVATLVTQRHRNGEPLIHCAVFIDISAPDMAKLSTLKDFVTAELARCKLTPDPLLLRQREGFQAANPTGFNAFGSQFERVLPASSVANLDFFNYSGKTDPRGFYVGRDRYGSNVIVDLDRRAEDKTTASVLILGNSGQGKSHLLKLLLCNILESGKSAICLDPEHELIDLCANLGGCFVDLMDGRYRINPLEPKAWDVGAPIEAQRSGFDGERSRSGMSELSPSGGSEGYEACGDDEDDEKTDEDENEKHYLSSSEKYKVYIDAPDGVEAYLDGSYVGVTPVSFNKEPGSHVVTLRKSGYQTRSYTLQIDEEEKDVNYSFTDLIKIEE